MAEDSDDTERSEDPTQKRLDEALKRGDVVKSQEVSTWFVLGAGTLVLLAFSGPMSASLLAMFRGILSKAHAIPVDGGGLLALGARLENEVVAAVAVPFLLRILRRDPQVAAGPIALAVADMMTLLVYFNLARWLLS